MVRRVHFLCILLQLKFLFSNEIIVWCKRQAQNWYIFNWLVNWLNDLTLLCCDADDPRQRVQFFVNCWFSSLHPSYFNLSSHLLSFAQTVVQSRYRTDCCRDNGLMIDSSLPLRDADANCGAESTSDEQMRESWFRPRVGLPATGVRVSRSVILNERFFNMDDSSWVRHIRLRTCSVARGYTVRGVDFRIS